MSEDKSKIREIQWGIAPKIIGIILSIIFIVTCVNSCESDEDFSTMKPVEIIKRLSPLGLFFPDAIEEEKFVVEFMIENRDINNSKVEQFVNSNIVVIQAKMEISNNNIVLRYLNDDNQIVKLNFPKNAEKTYFDTYATNIQLKLDKPIPINQIDYKLKNNLDDFEVEFHFESHLMGYF